MSDLPHDPAGAASSESSPGRSPWLWALGGFVLAAVLAVLGVVLIGDDDDEVATATTTTLADTTSTPSTTSEDRTTEAGDGSTTTIPEELRTAVWPWADSSQRFDDPVAAARSFAVDYAGFTDPVLGEFLQGDSRSGEVEVRASESGPATTVFVRQLTDDDTWWVLGSATENVEVDEPEALQAVDSPLRLTGRARAFEGTVNVEVRVDGNDEPLGEGFVTGSGDGTLGPFSSDLEFTNPGGGWGAILFRTYSMEDGRVWEAGVLRVGFVGGD